MAKTKQSTGLSDRQTGNDGYLLRKSKSEDERCKQAVLEVIDAVKKGADFCGIEIYNRHILYLHDMVNYLSDIYPDESFGMPSDLSSIQPDGGITYIKDINGKSYPILIVEMMSQGKQAMGTAVERLGKNVIGFRTLLSKEGIMPFVCFCDGCDFEEGSSIRDRVLTIAMFGELNMDHTMNEGPNGVFSRGSYYCRVEPWEKEEMKNILLEVAKRSIYHYFSVYGKEAFVW